MATLVDAVTLLKDFGLYDTVFPGILIFALVYGILYKYKPLGDNVLVNSVIALVIALIFISAMRAIKFISFLVPLVTAMVVVLLLLLLIFTFMGVPGETIKEAMLSPQAYGIIIILFLIFVLIAISASFPELSAGEDEISATTQDKAFMKAIGIFFHPIVLGLIAMIAIMATATYYITRHKE